MRSGLDLMQAIRGIGQTRYFVNPILRGVSEVMFTDEFGRWFEGLTHADQLSVYAVVDKLEVLGISLGYPHSSAIEGARSKEGKHD